MSEVDSVIPSIGDADEPYDARRYNELRLVPISRIEEPIPLWGCMPASFTTSLQKRAPVSYLRKALADRLSVKDTDVSFVWEGSALNCDLTISDNGVVEPGAAARKRGAKIEIFFIIREGVLPGSLAQEERDAAKKAEALAKAGEEKRIADEKEAERKSALKWATWRADALSGDATSKAQMPSLNFARLMTEFRSVKKNMQDDAAFVERCEPDGENLLIWHVDITFPEDSSMQQSLEELAKCMLDETVNVLTLQICFPPDYPHSPPQIYVQKPRLKAAAKHGTSPVSFGGRICSPLLYSKGWNSKVTVLGVLEQVQQELVAVGAEVDVAVAIHTAYVSPPPQLDRIKSDRYPTLYKFEKLDMKLGSPDFLGALMESEWLETGDTIGLPAEFEFEIYSQLEDAPLECPILFEVTSAAGRKVHCGKPRFLSGLPGNYALLPKWLITELLVEYNDKVRIRCVSLERITFVKIQPHSADFVADVAGKAEEYLTYAFKKGYSALTEDTSVALEVDGKLHMVQIVNLQPEGAVRLIDTDMENFFSFKVDFEKAPEIEFEEDAAERHKKLIAKMKEKTGTTTAAAEESADARMDRIKKEHFEWLKKTTKASIATSDDGKEGEVLINLRLPGGKTLTGKFRDGALVSALMALVLESDWAEACHPWGIKCTEAFPRRELHESDTISRSMNRSSINVAELKPDSDDDILSWSNPDLVTTSAESPVSIRREKSQPLVNQMIPDQVDEGSLMQATMKAFYAQCQAISHQSSPDVPDIQSPQASDPAVTHEAMIARFCDIVNVESDIARQFLEAAGWNEEQAMTLMLDGQ